MYGISSEKIYPADYYESQIPLVEDYVRSHSDKGISSLQQEDVSELITGDTIYYQFTDKNGKKLYGTSRSLYPHNGKWNKREQKMYKSWHMT